MLLAIMRKAAMLLLAVIGFSAFAKAQTVTGTVTDSKGDPVSGISVTVKGTTNTIASNVTSSDFLYFAGSAATSGFRPGVLHIIDRVLLP